jgi:hypothetical protein
MQSSATTKEMMRELDELRRGWQMLQIERDGVYMGFGTTNTAFTKKQRDVSIDELRAIRSRIHYLESVV